MFINTLHGIWLENTLFWDSHVSNICAKFIRRRALGLLRRTFTTKNRKGIEVAFKLLFFLFLRMVVKFAIHISKNMFTLWKQFKEEQLANARSSTEIIMLGYTLQDYI